MFKKVKVGIFGVVLALVMLFGIYTPTYASNISEEVEVKEKILLYDLDNIEDLLKDGVNEITYHWTDLSGINRSVDLIINVSEKGILSVDALKDVKNSIENKDSGVNILAAPNYPQVPYKTNGGSTRSQFVNDHAYTRHKYDKNASSSCSRTRYAQDVGVSSLRSSTVAKADEKYSIANPASHVYVKRYSGRTMNMWIADKGYTYYHRVLNNYSDPKSSTHHPLCK